MSHYSEGEVASDDEAYPDGNDQKTNEILKRMKEELILNDESHFLGRGWYTIHLFLIHYAFITNKYNMFIYKVYIARLIRWYSYH